MHSLLMADAVADNTKRTQNEANRDGMLSIRDSDNRQQTERQENTLRKANLQQQAVELIKQLSTEKLKMGRLKRWGDVRRGL